MVRVNPKIDVVFKKLFGSEENKDILKSLLNAILPQDEQVKELILKNPYNLSDYAGGKLSVLDIKAQDEKDTWYDIEMQINGHTSYGKRALFYWAKVYSQQLEEGQEYDDLRKTVIISLIDFIYFQDEQRYHRRLALRDTENCESHKDFDYLDLHFVELQKPVRSDLKQAKSVLDRWVNFLNNAYRYDKNQLPHELNEIQEIRKAAEKLEIMSFSEQERNYYEQQQKFFRDEQARIKSAISGSEMRAKKAEENAKKAEENAKKAEENAKKAEENAKKAEENAKIEIAKELKASGVNITIIMKSTGLSRDEIEKL